MRRVVIGKLKNCHLIHLARSFSHVHSLSVNSEFPFIDKSFVRALRLIVHSMKVAIDMSTLILRAILLRGGLKK